jgi:amyloid beta precursor protein binding protein 1
MKHKLVLIWVFSYREKALGDLEAVTKRVKALTEGSEFDIPTQTIESFCKNAASIKVVQYNTLKESKSPHEKLCKCLGGLVG